MVFGNKFSASFMYCLLTLYYLLLLSTTIYYYRLTYFLPYYLLLYSIFYPNVYPVEVLPVVILTMTGTVGAEDAKYFVSMVYQSDELVS